MNDKIDRELAQYLFRQLEHVRSTQGEAAFQFELEALDPGTRRQVVAYKDSTFAQAATKHFWASAILDFVAFGSLGIATFGIIYLLT